jgi:hypothetical protein
MNAQISSKTSRVCTESGGPLLARFGAKQDPNLPSRCFGMQRFTLIPLNGTRGHRTGSAATPDN